MSDVQPTPRASNVDHRDRRQITQLLAETLLRFPDWRTRCAFMAAAAERPGGDYAGIASDCAKIRAEVLAARTDILFALADAPARLAGHSRVVDVERALDSVDRSIDAVERRLPH